MRNTLEKKVETLVSPFQKLVNDETVSSVFLFAATLLALALANSPLAHDYLKLLHTPIGIEFGRASVGVTLQHIINDGLMALFFLVLGLEIKRELLVGELRDDRRAGPVLAAALGGMLVPALIYFSFNVNQDSVRGWGIPMATDSAFALGVLMLLGSRVNQGLKAFLVAYAIIDDLGAIMVIALFYTESLNFGYFAASAACVGLLVACNVLGLRHILLYLVAGILLWICLLNTGIHGTVAGVLVAATVPARPKRGRSWFVERTRRLTGHLENLHERQEQDGPILADSQQHEAVEAVKQAAELATTPLQRWTYSLERPVLLLVLPLFALANAAITLDFELGARLIASPLSWGIAFGLVFGKGIGIGLFAWIVLRLGWGRLPDGTAMRHVVGLGLLGGMGFTMSIFIADLSFGEGEELVLAKAAILFASAVAGASGYVWLRLCREA